MVFALRSAAFGNGDRIPEKYARDGQNLSPPLTWSDTPAGAKSLVLVVEDPDAPSRTFRHWAVYDVAPGRTDLSEGTGSASNASGLGQGINDFGNGYYDGPQPPCGHGVHHYHFKLMALDVESLNLDRKMPIEELLKTAEPHVVATAELVGTFERV